MIVRFDRIFLLCFILLIAAIGYNCGAERAVQMDGPVHDLTVADTSTLDNGSAPDAPAHNPDLRAPDILSGQPFGSLCTNLGRMCKVKDKDGSDLFCAFSFPAPPNKGYCSRRCTAGKSECSLTAKGTQAACILWSPIYDDAGTAPQKFCGFICSGSTSTPHCPPGLQCFTPPYPKTATCVPSYK